MYWSTYTSAVVTVVRWGASRSAATAPVTAHETPARSHSRPISRTPTSGSRQTTPAVSAMVETNASAALAYSSSSVSGSGICRIESRPRRALALNSLSSVRVRNEFVQLPEDSPVTSCMAATVALPPHSNASATATTAGVHLGSFGAGLTARPLLDTIRESRATSAAPVSSIQPIPASDKAERAPGDMSRATTRSGRPSRVAISSRAWRSLPSPSQTASMGSPFKRKQMDRPFSRTRRTSTERGNTAATASAQRSRAGVLATVSAQRGLHESRSYHNAALSYLYSVRIQLVFPDRGPFRQASGAGLET